MGLCKDYNGLGIGVEIVVEYRSAVDELDVLFCASTEIGFTPKFLTNVLFLFAQSESLKCWLIE